MTGASRFALFVTLASTLSACTKTAETPPPNKYDQKPKGALIEEVAPEEPENWFLKGPASGAEGTGADDAYSQLPLSAGSPIIVAVIDSGVDIDHEDLKGRIWVNAKEIPNNNVDDDGNGYVDDVNGWSFLGSLDKEGKIVNLEQEQLEVTRELVRLKRKKAASGDVLSPEDQTLLDEYTKVVEKERADATEEINTSGALAKEFESLFPIVQPTVGGELKELTLAKVEAISSNDSEVNEAKEKLIALFVDNKLTDASRIYRRIENAEASLKYHFNEEFEPRKHVIGDDPENYDDRAYGNNDVKGPEGSHGTHVSGIIAATRGNGIGIDGVAASAIIMPIRAVPDGDERDKDVANSIRYAVDNGARVINMSFGKGYSPGKAAVDQAMLYAESKGVLIVHASGNSSQDIDAAPSFPSRKLLGENGRALRNWLEIGASSFKKSEVLPAAFSNYGQREVDFFAPGVKIKSTIPGNEYAAFSGTSMASPVAAGVAALVLGQKPSLDARGVRDLLRANVRTYDGLVVRLPGSDPIQATLFSRLSLTGGIVDAFATIKKVLP